MDWIVTTGSTVDEALDVALDELAVTHDDIEFEVITEGRKSVFGFRRSVAQVRARVRPIEPPAKREWKRPSKSDKRKKARKATTAGKSKPNRNASKKSSTNTKTQNNKSGKQRNTTSAPKNNNSKQGEPTPKTANTRKRTISGSPQTSNVRSIDVAGESLPSEPLKTRRTRKIDH